MTKYERRLARDVLAKLVEAHPRAIFPKDSPNTRPLKEGVMNDLIAAHPEIKRYHLNCFIGVYTNKSRYHRGMLEHAHRVDLDGNSAQPVKLENRERARGILLEREKERQRREALGNAKGNGRAGGIPTEATGV